MDDPKPTTPDQIKHHLAALHAKLGPPVLTESERKEIETEIAHYQSLLDGHQHSHARDRAGIEARNRGADPHQAQLDYDKVHGPAMTPRQQAAADKKQEVADEKQEKQDRYDEKHKK